MGASFRNIDQIKALAGCDNLTIAPKLLDDLSHDNAHLPRALSIETAKKTGLHRMDEAAFRWEMNADPMATEKLADGIRNFDLDHQRLIEIVSQRL